MSKRHHKIMTEAECDALCAWLAGPQACSFQQQLPGDVESITWTCDGTLQRTRHWMRAHGVDEAATIAELEERGGYRGCEVLISATSSLPKGSLRLHCQGLVLAGETQNAEAF